MREPLETGQVVLLRSGGAVRYPARFQLVLAANPCPCARRRSECVCAAPVRRRYDQRLSGPLLDRIDLRVPIEPVSRADLFDPATARETSAVVIARVAGARAAAAKRWVTLGHRVNATVPGAVLRSAPWLPPYAVLAEAERDLERGVLTARGFDRVLRIAWTTAHLAGRDRPTAHDVSEALYFRTGGVRPWAAA